MARGYIKIAKFGCINSYAVKGDRIAITPKLIVRMVMSIHLPDCKRTSKKANVGIYLFAPSMRARAFS